MELFIFAISIRMIMTLHTYIKPPTDIYTYTLNYSLQVQQISTKIQSLCLGKILAFTSCRGHRNLNQSKEKMKFTPNSLSPT